jgi:Holliday junction resolvasome RuvABC endonuclease subunit
MRVLGIDPSLTAFGWALHDTSAPLGDPSRCAERGRFSTPSKMEFLDRYRSMRDSLREVVRRLQPDRVGIEFPIFNDLFSEGMYGLFLFSCDALKLEGCDVVFWTPLQAKAHAREKISRPKGWKMDKKDMVEAAKADAGPGQWNHNEADAYHIAVLAARFWAFYEGSILEADLSPVEKRYFSRVHTYQRGRKAGKTVKTGMIHRENDRFFLWSQE